jgi:hypothetical protein
MVVTSFSVSAEAAAEVWFQLDRWRIGTTRSLTKTASKYARTEKRALILGDVMLTLDGNRKV